MSRVIGSVEELVRILREPTGCTIPRNRKRPPVEATREVYKTQGGGWSVTHRGGELPEHIFQEAVRTGAIIDAYAGKFEGAHAGVGYDLPERVEKKGAA